MNKTEQYGWPNETSLLAILAQWRGVKAYEVPLSDRRGRRLGNHGDALMYQVYRAIASAADIQFVGRPEFAELLVLPPNGALIDTYKTPEILGERLALLPNVPLVIFPSSALFRSLDPTAMFQSRTAPVTWILREEHSYRHLSECWGESLKHAGVSLILDHDVVASGHLRVESILRDACSSQGASSDILVASRLDVESRPLAKTPMRVSLVRRALVGVHSSLPLAIRRQIRRRTTASRQRNATDELMSRMRSWDGKATDACVLSPKSLDVSDPTLVSFGDYAAAVLGSRTVVTNRLHVALPSAAVGNQTYLMDSGYHKLRGVYERSLARVPNIVLIPR